MDGKQKEGCLLHSHRLVPCSGSSYRPDGVCGAPAVAILMAASSCLRELISAISLKLRLAGLESETSAVRAHFSNS